MKKIVICGGHLTPALALIEQLKKHNDLEIIFFGRKYSTEGTKSLSAEFKIISKLNIKFYAINAGRLQRKFTLYTIPALLKVPVGFIQSFIYLSHLRPKLIVSFGSYVSLPVVFCGWLIGISSIMHEQSSIPGFANKINSIFAEKNFLAWPQAKKYFDKNKTAIIGNLTRQSIFHKKAQNSKLNQFLKKSKKLILILGGNQGSHFINKQIFELLPKLSHFDVLHQVGTANFDGDLDKAKKIKSKNYFPVDYIGSEDIGAVLTKADLVISRSGANTIWDIAILGKVSILIPLSFAAGNEQEENAKILQDTGVHQLLKQEDTSAKTLLSAIDHSFSNFKALKQSAAKLQKTLPKDAAVKLASHILSYT